MTALRDDALDEFRLRFGRDPDGVWSAPGRVNLIGEHTDYNGGFVLPFAIDRRTVAIASLRDDDRIRVSSTLAEEVVETSLSELDAERIRGWSAYPLGVAWALGRAGADLAGLPGFDLHLDSDVPVGAGLSSSAAIECATVAALNDLWRLGLGPAELIRAGQRAENDVVGAPTGILDQSASVLGEREKAIFLDCRSGRSRTVSLSLADNGLEAIVIDTGVEHAHASGGYAERHRSCEDGARALGVPALREIAPADLPRARELLDPVTFRRVRHVVTENQRVLDTVEALEESGPRAIGDLLDASHRSLRDDFEVSVPELDLAVETAQNYGAIGARMTGGGFGGSAIALVPVHLVSQVRASVESAFAEHGYAAPTIFAVRADDGARREA